MKYIEKDALYEVRIPDDYIMESNSDKSYSLESYKKYWNGRVVQVTEVWDDSIRGPSPIAGSNSKFDIPKCWLSRLVRHCPQVEYYIKMQEEICERYVSPFTNQSV